MSWIVPNIIVTQWKQIQRFHRYLFSNIWSRLLQSVTKNKSKQEQKPLKFRLKWAITTRTVRQTNRKTNRCPVKALASSGRLCKEDVIGCHGNRRSARGLELVANGNAAEHTAELRTAGVWHNLIGWRSVGWVTWPADNHQIQNAWSVTQLLLYTRYCLIYTVSQKLALTKDIVRNLVGSYKMLVSMGNYRKLTFSAML